MREHRRNHRLLDMLEAFRPDYLVLRPDEIRLAETAGDGWLGKEYEVVRAFRVPEVQVRQMLFPEANVDLEYVVFGRKPAGLPR